MSIEQRAEQFQQAFARLQAEIGKVIVGQKEIVEDTLVCFSPAGSTIPGALLEDVRRIQIPLLVRRASLEDVFLNLTGRGLRE